MPKFSDISEAIADFKNGKMLIVTDDEDRENEGDLVMSASLANADDINFMAMYGRGLICAPVSFEIADRLGLEPMVQTDACTGGVILTNFTVSVDYRHGTSTGISMADRAKTVNALAEKQSKCDDFIKPGHIFPLRAHPGGLKARRGHTEAALELTRLAGLENAAVICEIINDDGTMARMPDLECFAEKFHLRIITIKDLANFSL